MMDNEGKIQLLEYRKPALEAGDYKIRVEQSIKHMDPGIIDETFPYKELHFSVQGERFSLDPSAIHAMFPPPGSLGRHTDCLPHIAITRGTFPWERSAYGNEDYEPWLALLLFDEEEIKAGDVTESIITLGTLITDSYDSSKPKFPGVYRKNETQPVEETPKIGLETGQNDDDKVSVIDVKKSLLEKIIPGGAELKLLAHVRQRVNSSPDVPDTELAVLMGNRLPKEGSDSTVYLVSVENRYKSDKSFDFQEAADTDCIRLISLHKWSFACLPEQGKDFEELAAALDLQRLRIPNPAGSMEAEKYLSRGYVPLLHQLRQCDKTYSWYHGPLATHATAAKFQADSDLPGFGDSLIRYHDDCGMFDISYAAAFEMGRAMAIEDRLFAAALFQLKQHHNEEILMGLEAAASGKIVTQQPKCHHDVMALESKISNWFNEAALLKGVPFNYLLADEKMLPPESMRFFKLDNHWLECLLYGAFSIGGTIRTEIFSIADPNRTFNGNLDEIRDQFTGDYSLSAGAVISAGDNNEWIILDNDNKYVIIRKGSTLYVHDGKGEVKLFNRLTGGFDQTVTGFITRSELVSGYPDILVDAYSNVIDHLNPLTQTEKDSQLSHTRFERAGPDMLFCLCAGDMKTVEFYLKPEGLHFGLDEELDGEGPAMKYEKDIDKKISEGNYERITVSLPDLIKPGDKRVLKITESDTVVVEADRKGIADQITTALGLPAVVDAAQFGMHMLEGSNKGRFVIA